MAGVELGKLRSKAFARWAPVGAEIKQQSGLGIEGARGAGIVVKANLGDQR